METVKEIVIFLSLLEAAEYAVHALFRGIALFVASNDEQEAKPLVVLCLIHHTLPVISDVQIVSTLSLDSIMVSQSCIGYVVAVYQSEQDNCLVLPTSFSSSDKHHRIVGFVRMKLIK